jgi:hypothetical protein
MNPTKKRTRPRTRLHTVLPGLVGLLAMTMSPFCKGRPSLTCRQSTTTMSPASLNVGSMEGPASCCKCVCVVW